MKKMYIGIALAAAMTLASLVWYGCTKEEELKGTIYGTVTDYSTGSPIGNASVKLRPSGETTLTGSDGTYEFKDLDAGKYSLLLSKAEYADLDDDYIIELEAGKKVKRDVQMRKQIASLQIVDMNGNPIDTLDFGDGESVTVKTFNIFNNGTEKLSCSANYECEWITNVSGLENDIPAGQTVPVTVRIDRVALADGVNTTFLYIISGNGSNEVVVKATFKGTVAITTSQPTSVTATSATVGGNITDDGGRPVTARGICYGTSQTPDIDGDHTEDGSGTGTFSHNITGLSSSTTYYARAYATNRNGTYYASNIVSFTTTDGLPTVTTTAISDITATTAKSGGNVTNNGGYNVTARGVCWNTLGGPDLNDQHTTNGSGNGTFTSNMTGLTAGTTYYVRAYATNSQGTAYGEEQQFTALDGAVSMMLSDAENITATTATCNVEITDDGGSSVTERGICWGSSQYPTTNDYHVAVGSGTGSFTASMSGLFPSITYYVRAYAVNEAGTSYSNQISFTTTSGLATVSTGVASNITATSATYSGSITDNGGYNVTARGFCWNTTGNPDISDSHTTNGTGSGTFTGNLTGLTPGTTYHVRAYATNSTGTSYGNETTFTTSSGSVTMTLAEATNITASSASCSVTISDDGGASITERGICWSTAQYPTTASSNVATGSGTGTFSVSMTSLSPATTYYVRAYAVNAAGTAYSNQITVTTISGLPTVSTGAASNITATSATYSGSITDNGGYAVTARGFCWNTTGNPTLSDSTTTNGSGSGTFTGNLTDLSASTTYHVRAYATNSQGTSYGNESTFTTSSGSVTMTIAAATNITATSATCNVNITNDGGAAITERGICWSTAQYPTTAGSSIAVGSGTGSFTASMSGLSISTTYYVRAYAINTTGTNYSNQISFTTANGLPTVTTGSVSNITAETATCSGNVTSDGGFAVTAKGFCWSTSQYPTISGSHTNNGSGTGSFNGSLSNLEIGTTYYVRAYATNSTGTSYGDQVSFTTGNGLPTVTTTIVGENVTESSAVSGGQVTDDGGYMVTARGVCWSLLPYPTINDSKTNNGSGTGYFSSNITGINLNSSATYYIRAYATNINGTSYGEQVLVNIENLEYRDFPTIQYGGYTYRLYLDMGSMTWSAAVTACENLEFAGYDDWELPENENVLSQIMTACTTGWKKNDGSDFVFVNSSNPQAQINVQISAPYWTNHSGNYNSYYHYYTVHLCQYGKYNSTAETTYNVVNTGTASSTYAYRVRAVRKYVSNQ